MQGNDNSKPQRKMLNLNRSENMREQDNKVKMIREMDWDGVLELINLGY